MMNSGLTFGSDGPMMEGTWYNTQTGDSFTVRDSFFEDNQFVVTTTDGRLLNYEQIQNYVKSDKPIEVKKSEPKSDVLPSEVMDLLEPSAEYDILPEDLAIIQNSMPARSLGNIGNPPTISQKTMGNLNESTHMQVVQNTPINPNKDIISKALSKRTLPEFQIGIDWLDFPKKEIDMLMDLMDIPGPEIVDWYLSKVDINTTTLMIKEVIKDYLKNQLNPVVDTNTEPVEVIPQSQDMNTVATIEKPVKTKKVAKKTKK